MAIVIKLEVFEGPLDLLLHLIEKNKVDIYDIPIVEITDQYLEYVRNLESEDMNIISEFLLMAATLIDIKCKMLLPKQETEEDEDEGDPRAELVEKLLEYKMYKYMSLELKDRQMSMGHSIYKKASIPKEIEKYRPPVDYEELVGDMNLAKLNNIYKELLKRQVDKIDPVRSHFGNIEKDEVNLEERMNHIATFARTHKKFSFRQLMGSAGTKMEMVVTFLVVLEYMKIGRFTVTQEHLFDDIEIEFHEGVGEDAGVLDGISE